jgi:hypothetical protein
MSTTHKNEKSIPTEKPAWGLDTNSLDDWLENDVKHSNLLDSRHKDITTQTDTKDETSIKGSLNHVISHATCSLIKQENTTPAIKIEEDDQKSNEIVKADNPPAILPQLIPIMKVYSLLNSIRQNEQLVRERQHSKKRLYATSPPPSPSLSIDSEQPVTCHKKKRSNSRGPVDLAVKRQRNTDAARRSRLRKAIKMETLEKRVEMLKTDNERLRVKVAVLETEVTHVSEKERRNRQRVLELEAQLAIAHKQLVEEYQK